MQVLVRPLLATDWPQVSEIYEQGIASGIATFETRVPSWEEWDATHHSEPRLVAEREDRLLGWVALSPVSRRKVYEGVAESSVYVHRDARRSGVGRMLVDAMVQASELAGFWTLQAGIFTSNEVSVRLHVRCGFRVVGVREKIAQVNGEWHDVLLMERRSRVVSSSAAELPDR